MLDGLSNTIGIDFDWSEQQLYYSDVNNDKIVRCFLDGSKCEDVITTGLLMPEGKAKQMFYSTFLHRLCIKKKIYRKLKKTRKYQFTKIEKH